MNQPSPETDSDGASIQATNGLGFSTTGEVIHVDAGFHMMGMAADEEG